MKEIIFADAEFIGISSDGIDIISIALIKEDGSELYLELEYFSEPNDWTKKNVVPFLKGEKISRDEARKKIIEFIGDKKPFFLSYVNCFDWMGICRLFGIDGHPFFWKPLDFATILYEKGYDITKSIDEIASDLGINLENFNKHNALDDARLLKEVFEKVNDIKN